MNHQLCYLAVLAQKKNDINRRRRRFYSLIERKTKYLGRDARGEPMIAKHPRHKSYTKRAAIKGYRQAQADMKAMTKEMREVRKLAGARLHWGDSGNIQAIVVNGEGPYRDHCIYPKQWQRLIDLYNADKILLGD